MMKGNLMLFMLCITACNQMPSNGFGQGGKNAAQFVREQTQELKSEIESIETTFEDSLLTDRIVSFGQIQFAKAGTDYWEDKITSEQYQNIIDSSANVIQDIQYSWQFSNVINDSLKLLSKYSDNWAKVYTVTVTIKSGIKKDIRILMDKDGITPRMTEKQFEDELQDYAMKMIQAQKDIHIR